ncbi:tRNA (5-methylaminomethyl-2-thiouridine)(34)-methyltransferase MnmD [Nitrosophilus kaiyonis]|uniref:tRNA (5-methylaminomethyl-2-thiouridine)(34)-methyltransferase MnmD n=1 Tax=Nitrosophilus kaiyonis TaxID=2930200 RepID=UPI002490E2CE|nr:MnmC family methyltransferase [Nitrosophilus kaiyonis]
MKIVKSLDGTFTAYSENFDECYHNIKDGALSESLKKHVEVAFKFFEKKDDITILDICFGLGYNTFSTLYYLKKENINKKIHIISPEMDKELVQSLKNFSYPKEFDFLKDIIEKISNDFYYEDENIKIEVKIGNARDIIKKIDKKIDIVYQDPFSPKKNPLLWTVEYFKDISKILDYNALITTYSIATPVRLALYEAGFRVYEREIEGLKKQTIASFKSLPFKEINMKEKKRRSSSQPLRDKDVKKI